ESLLYRRHTRPSKEIHSWRPRGCGACYPMPSAALTAGPSPDVFGRDRASADGSGGELGDTFDLEDQYGAPMRTVRGGADCGMAGFDVLVGNPNSHEQAGVDAERARRLGLDYMPEDEYQLTAPRTMAELLDRERRQGHTNNVARERAAIDRHVA